MVNSLVIDLLHGHKANLRVVFSKFMSLVSNYKDLVLIGAWPLLTSITGIKTINFISLLTNSEGETVMSSLEEGMI